MCDIQRLRQKISDLVNDKYQDYLVEPLKSVSSAAHAGAINTGDACACYVNFGVEVSGDDRDIEWIGLGLDLADVPNGTLFAMKQFSISALSGVAVRRKRVEHLARHDEISPDLRSSDPRTPVIRQQRVRIVSSS